ncbi:uncharacterized protein B4U79_19058, partial [Dinothrombium tinctorium]
MANVCLVCDLNENGKGNTLAKQGVQCSYCGRKAHSNCVNLNKETLDLIKKSKKNFKWFCDDCNDKLENGFKIGNDLNQIIIELKTQIESLSNTVKEILSKDSSRNNTMLEVLTELEERQQKEKNLIIFNITEPNDDNTQKRKENDMNTVKSIIDTIEPEIVCKVKNVIRLGKKDSKNRPIRVISIKNKLIDLELLISNENPDIIMLTETWLDQDHSKIINFKNYEILHKYNTSHKGGVSVLIKNSLNAHEILKNEQNFDDSVFFELNLPNSSIVIGCIYRSTSSDESNDINLIEFLKKVGNIKCQTIVCGDFNAPEVDWQSRIAQNNSYA